MQETLLDFDAADASGDQGAVTPLNLKTSDIKLHITEISAMMREWSMPRADALAELVEGRSRWNRGLSGRKEAS
jgi:hypothetical protein